MYTKCVMSVVRVAFLIHFLTFLSVCVCVCESREPRTVTPPTIRCCIVHEHDTADQYAKCDCFVWLHNTEIYIVKCNGNGEIKTGTRQIYSSSFVLSDLCHRKAFECGWTRCMISCRPKNYLQCTYTQCEAYSQSINSGKSEEYGQKWQREKKTCCFAWFTILNRECIFVRFVYKVKSSITMYTDIAARRYTYTHWPAS